MPPEAESPPVVVVGPSSRFAMPSTRVCTSSPVPVGADLRVVFALAFFAEAFFFGVAAFRLVAFFEPGLAAFGLAFFAVPPAAFFFGVFCAVFFAEVFAVFFAAPFDRFTEVRAAMPCPPSRASAVSSARSVAGSTLARKSLQHGEVFLPLGTQGDDVVSADADLGRDLEDLVVFERRDVRVGGGDRVETSDEQDPLFG